MGRRKKEPPSTHRENIAATAAQLFHTRGFAATTMDDIARQAHQQTGNYQSAGAEKYAAALWTPATGAIG